MTKQLNNTVMMSSFSPSSSSSSPPRSSSSAPGSSTSWVRGGCIGRGAYGTVSLGISKVDGRVFAVKSVDKKSCLPAQLDALENEISILKSLSSPFIVEYYADDLTIEEAEEYHSHHHSTTRRLYRNLHMEYVPCAADVLNYQSASSANGDYLLEKEEENDESLLRRYAWCLVSALHYVHSNGIVHCDVKPNNVLLDSTSRIAKLADFGSSKRIDLHSSPASSSSSKIMPRGSPLWMAPEVVRGESQGFESDVWSLGCTIIEIITGKPAWNHQGGAETLCKIGYSDELPAMPTRLSECGRDFLDKCLKRDPNQRWSCHQLLQHPFLTGCSVPTNKKIIPVAATATGTATDSSPRCVFDWTTDLEPSEEEEDEEGIEFDSCWNPDGESESVNWSDKIDKLATNSKVIWESDGWEVVRNLTEGEDDSAAGVDDDDYAYDDDDGSCFRGDEIEDDYGCQLAGPVSTRFDLLDTEVDIPRGDSEYFSSTSIAVDDNYDNNNNNNNNNISRCGGCDGGCGGVGSCKARSRTRTGCRCCGGARGEDSGFRVTCVVVELYSNVFLLLSLLCSKHLRFNNTTLFFLFDGLHSLLCLKIQNYISYQKKKKKTQNYILLF